MWTFVSTAYKTVGAVSSTAGAVSGWLGGYEASAESSIADHYYDPILTLFELAMIPLEKNKKKKNIRLYFMDVITRCPDTWMDKVYRTATRYNPISQETQERVQAVKLIPVIVRAIRWYDPCAEGDINRSVAFLFEKAIEGLEIYEQTYEDGEGKETRIAIDAIRLTSDFLKYKLYGDDFEKGNPRKREKVQSELDRAICQQEEADEVLKDNELYIDSRKFWVVDAPDDGEPFEKLTNPVKDHQELYRLKDVIKANSNPKYRTTFCDSKKEFEAYLESRQLLFIKTYLDKNKKS